MRATTIGALLACLASACEPSAPPAGSPSSAAAAGLRLPSPADRAAAEQALRAYLAAARTGAYARAMAQYEGTWRPQAAAWFEGGDTLDATQFLAAACRGLLFSHLDVRRIASAQFALPDTHSFTLELTERDGTRFAPPPCCGEEGGPDTLFTFRVRRSAEGYRMLDLPVYRP